MQKRIVFAVSVIVVVCLALAFVSVSNKPSAPSGLMALSLAGSAVSRSFTSPVNADANLSVTLTVTVAAGDAIYGIDETFPSGFTVVDGNGGTVTPNGHIMWIITGSSSGTKTYTYKIKAPSTAGTYTFSGIYQFESASSSSSISGSTSITVNIVSACAGQANGTTCGTGKYCCGGSCATAPVSCPTCKDNLAKLCSGTTAVCGNSSALTTCGTTVCPANFCSGTGNNTLNVFGSTCTNFCSGLGSCTICSCSATLTNCGMAGYCSALSPSCVSCATNLANCDATASNGCEVNLKTSSTNCGACDNSCGTGLGCANGSCILALCAEHPERYGQDEFEASVPQWYAGSISLSEIVLRARLYIHCTGVGS